MHLLALDLARFFLLQTATILIVYNHFRNICLDVIIFFLLLTKSINYFLSYRIIEKRRLTDFSHNTVFFIPLSIWLCIDELFSTERSFLFQFHLLFSGFFLTFSLPVRYVFSYNEIELETESKSIVLSFFSSLMCFLERIQSSPRSLFMLLIGVC